MSLSLNTKLGFTGTREGWTTAQAMTVRRLLVVIMPGEVHHGDCIGSDAEFHELVREVFATAVKIVGHPPSDPKQRAWKIVDMLLPEKPYLTRNKNIVDATEVLIGTPSEDEEPKPARGQGTWSTIRYGRDKAKHRPTVYVVWPDGHFDRSH